MNIRDEFPRAVHVLEHEWITLSDGARLNCRVWLPTDAAADPVPAILEASPYRLTDGGLRDWEIYPYWRASATPAPASICAARATPTA